MYFNRCQQQCIWVWTCTNSYPTTSTLMWQKRLQHSLQAIFTPVLRRSRLHVTPLLYPQWWSMPLLCGPTTLCRAAINLNRSSDVLLGFMSQVRENSQCDSNDERSEVRVTGDQACNNQRLTMFYRMQHNMVSDYSSWSFCSSSAVVQQKIGPRQNVSSSLCSDQCLQVLLSSNCTHVEYSTCISDPFSFTSVLQNRHQCL